MYHGSSFAGYISWSKKHGGLEQVWESRAAGRLSVTFCFSLILHDADKIVLTLGVSSHELWDKGNKTDCMPCELRNW